MSIARLLWLSMSLPLMAGMFAGCADLQHKDQTKKLDQAVRSYIHAVRWGDLGAAASSGQAKVALRPEASFRIRRFASLTRGSRKTGEADSGALPPIPHNCAAFADPDRPGR